MGRNNHNKLKNGYWKNRKFNLKETRNIVNKIQKAEEAAILLNAVLLLLPWAVLFACGSICPVIYV